MKWPPTNSHLLKRLGIRYPIIQAPMAGGITTPALVAAVSNAGGLGSLGAANLTPEEIRASIREIKGRTDKPFGVNLFIPQPFHLNHQKIARVSPVLKDSMKQLDFAQAIIDTVIKIADETSGGEDESVASDHYRLPFDKQAQVVLDEKVAVFSWTMGFPNKEWIRRFKEAGAYLVGTATNLEEAKACVAAGIDAIVAQGWEAGGHQGTFKTKVDEGSLIEMKELVRLIIKEIDNKLPVIAAGGIMDGKDIVGALGLGADAVQMGTAFIPASESGASASWKNALLSPEGRKRPTVLTKAFSGRLARGLKNTFIDKMGEENLPDFPILNALTRSIRQKAGRVGDIEYQSLWAGTDFSRTKGKEGELITVDQLMEELVREVQQQN